MLTNSPLFAGFAVDDIPRGQGVLRRTLGIRVVEIGDGLLSIQAANGYSVLAYIKPGHVPAAHTILNFPVDDIEATVDGSHRPASPSSATTRGRSRQQKGIAHPGPWQAWFRDPAGNILSVIQGGSLSRSPPAARTDPRCCHPGRGPWRNADPRRHPTARDGRGSRPRPARVRGVHLGRIRTHECQPDPVPTR